MERMKTVDLGFASCCGWREHARHPRCRFRSYSRPESEARAQANPVSTLTGMCLRTRCEIDLERLRNIQAEFQKAEFHFRIVLMSTVTYCVVVPLLYIKFPYREVSQQTSVVFRSLW